MSHAAIRGNRAHKIDFNYNVQLRYYSSTDTSYVNENPHKILIGLECRKLEFYE